MIDDEDIAALKLGKRATAQYAKAIELHQQLDRYAYGGPRVRFCDQEIDQARAAGAAIEFEHGAPLTVDRSLYRELVKQAISRTVSELQARVADQAAERQANRDAKRSQAADPLAQAERDEPRQLRVCGDQAHGVNLDLGASLLNGLSTVDPADMTVHLRLAKRRKCRVALVTGDQHVAAILGGANADRCQLAEQFD
jgi:hypothetical protein